MKTREETVKGKRRDVVYLIITIIIYVLMFLASIQYDKMHFDKNTFIQNVDCSFLTVNQAAKKIQKELKVQHVEFVFYNNIKNRVPGELFEFELSNTEEISQYLGKQNAEKTKENYILTSSLQVSEEKVKEYLSTCAQMQSFLTTLGDSYIGVDKDGAVSIVSKIVEIRVDYDKACDFAIKTLKQGGTVVDMRLITEVVYLNVNNSEFN